MEWGLHAERADVGDPLTVDGRGGTIICAFSFLIERSLRFIDSLSASTAWSLIYRVSFCQDHQDILPSEFSASSVCSVTPL